MTKNQLQFILILFLQNWAKYRLRKNEHHMSKVFNVNYFWQFLRQKISKNVHNQQKTNFCCFPHTQLMISYRFCYENVESGAICHPSHLDEQKFIDNEFLLIYKRYFQKFKSNVLTTLKPIESFAFRALFFKMSVKLYFDESYFTLHTNLWWCME